MNKKLLKLRKLLKKVFILKNKINIKKDITIFYNGNSN